MANQLTMRRLLGFKDFFPNETPKSKEHYASKLGKELIQKSTPFFLSYSRGGGVPEMNDFLQDFFTFYDHKFYKSPTYYAIEAEYRRIQNHHQGELHSVISVESMLNMFLWSYQDIDIPESIEPIEVSSMLSFFELILLFNDEVLANYEKASTSIAQYGEDRKLQRIILAGSFPQTDLVNIDYAQILYGQVYKLAKLLKFLESETKYQPLLTKLLAEFRCDTKEEYLKAICAAAVLPLNSPTPTWNVLTLKNSTEKENAAHILDQLSLSDTEVMSVDQDDYLQLRNKPFQKLSDEEYRVIFELFLVKKIYNGLIFKLSSYDRNFLGNIRIDFSEEVLVYENLQEVLDERFAIRITGNELKEVLDREPDFYFRSGDDILLFESKDFYIRGEYKLSYDFAIIERELMKQGRLKKAVVQLVKNIERCLLKEIPLDYSYHVPDITICPIIVIHDCLYSAPALNYWVYYWFMEELESLKQNPSFKDIDFSNIWPVTIVEIDSLILYENKFKQGDWKLVESVKDYQAYVDFARAGITRAEEIEDHAKKSALSFAEFLREKAHLNNVEINMDNVRRLLTQFGLE